MRQNNDGEQVFSCLIEVPKVREKIFVSQGHREQTSAFFTTNIFSIFKDRNNVYTKNTIIICHIVSILIK